MTRANPLTVLAAAVLTTLAGAALVTSGPGGSSMVLQGAGVSSSRGPSSGGTTNNGNTDPDTGCNTHGSCNGLPKDFGVTVGNVDGLYPGRSIDLPVTYTNPNAFPISVTGATVTAEGTTDCPATYLVTGSYPTSPNLTVPKNGSERTALPFGLSPDAPDACQGARWTVTVTAQAVK